MPRTTGSSIEERSASGVLLPTLTYEIRVLADSGTELETVIVKDRFDMPIVFQPNVEPCESNYYEGKAIGIARTRFPLNVEVSQCDGTHFGPEENPRLGVYPDYTDDDAPPLICSDVIGIPNPACDEVVSDARRTRAAMSRLCREIGDIRRQFRELLAIAAFFLAAFLFTFAFGMASIGGGLIGIIVGAVMLAIAAAYAILVGVFTDKAIRKFNELSPLEDELRSRRARFEQSLRLMYARCCPDQYLFLEEREMPC